MIVSGSSDNTIVIWDVATGEVLNTLVGHTDYVTSVAWSPNDLLIVSGSWDNTIIIWKAGTGKIF